MVEIKHFFESINEPIVNIDNQKTADIVNQIEKTEKLEDDLNKILGGKTKSQLNTNGTRWWC